MMIAKKLLACCSAAGGGSGAEVIFLVDFSMAPDGASAADLSGPLSIGAYHQSIGCAVMSGRLVIQPGGYYSCYNTEHSPILTDDFVVDLLFDGPESPAVNIGVGAGQLMLPSANQQIITWQNVANDHEKITVSPVMEPPSSHHVAIGRQAGTVQCWIDGVRTYMSANATSGALTMAGTLLSTRGASSLQLQAARVVRGNVYGDNAIITVPTLPLGIV